MRPLDVVVVNGHAVLGGAESWLLRLLAADAGRRMLVRRAAVLQEGPFVAALEQAGHPVTVVPTGTAPRDLVPTALALRTLLRREQPDVVLANGIKAALAVLPAARLLGIPVVWAKHDHAFDARLARPLGRAVDGLVAAVEELGEPTGRPDVVVVPPPRPDVAPLSRQQARSVLGARGVRFTERPVLVMVGRLIAYKGADDAVAALALPGGREWDLVVIGDDDPAEPGETVRLRDLAVAAGVEDRVQVVPAVQGVAHVLAAFDALAVLTKPGGPGTPGKEGFGTSAFEAMLAGVPVVGVEGGAVVRRLAGVAGTGVPAGAPGAVAAALGGLADPDRRRAAGRAGAALVADHPGALACADLLAAALARACSRPGAGRTDAPPASVVTTVRNEGAAVDDLVMRLMPQLGPDDELVVVDGGSTDDTVARLHRWSTADPRVRLLEVPGAGISAGRNAGVRAARHDLIACTDAGCVPDPGWLQALRCARGEPDGADLVTGVYRVSRRTRLQAAMAAGCYPDPREARRRTPLVRAYGRLLGRTFDPTLPTGRSVAFTRQAWAAAGGYPEDLATGEDVLFGRAVVASGGTAVLQADAEVLWEQRPTTAATAKMYYRYGVGGGHSGNRTLVGRDLARAAAYAVVPVVLLAGGRTARMLVAAGATGYLSLPVRRAIAGPDPVSTALLLPVAVAVRDLSKAAGCLIGLAQRRRRD